jgi:hypothetical protein
MNAVTFDTHKYRNNLTPSARKRLGTMKRDARHRFRAKLKHADRRTGYDGWVTPTHTKLDIS